MTLYEQCTNVVLESDKTKNLMPESAELTPAQVQITSSTTQIGVQDATYSVSFQPTTSLKEQGQIVIVSPPWYKQAEYGMDGVNQDLYREGLLYYSSQVSEITSTDATFTITDQFFDFSSNQLTITYSASALVTGRVTVTIVNVRSPVNS